MFRGATLVEIHFLFGKGLSVFGPYVDTRMREQLEERFSQCEFPEHVEKSLKPILGVAQGEVELSDEQWIDVFESLQSQVEDGTAGWIRNGRD